jgi:hypothetical protein
MTRGEKNNNPGNVRHGAGWVGLAPEQTDPDFCTFTAPEFGIRAMARILKNYQAAGIKTIEGVIMRWAPPSENNTSAYVHDVAVRCGVLPDAIVTITDYLPELINAIIIHENGECIYDDATIAKGIALA